LQEKHYIIIRKQVAAEEICNEVWKVFYRDVFLGYFMKMIVE